MLLGLRGVGKTVLLNQFAEMASNLKYQAIQIEVPDDQRLAQHLAPALKSTLVQLSGAAKARELVTKAWGALRGFASAFTVSIGDVVGIEVKGPEGADTGNLEIDLPDLLATVGQAARAAETVVVILLDEVQYLGQEDLSALIVAIHKICQGNLPVLLFGAGLPQVAGLAGDAKSYAERLFHYPNVGQLLPEAAGDAIRKPLEEQGVAIRDAALQGIVDATHGYPYFLQEWGKHAWNIASSSPIDEEDVEKASIEATASLDGSFFKVRYDRLAPSEKDYLCAMATLGRGPYRSGDIAKLLGRDVKSFGPVRASLIKKGMVWSPTHGEMAFSVPLFDEFMKRQMPDWMPPSSA